MASFSLSDIELNPLNHKVDFRKIDYMRDTTLRDYQIKNKKKIYDAWQTCRGVMLQMPTGTGKTRLFVSIVRDLHNWGIEHKTAVKILILAHRKELIDQIDETLGVKYSQAHGLIVSQNEERKKYPVQVGSVPTLNRRLERWMDKDFDVIIVDEAHHVKAASYKNILKQFPKAKILGVTATPYRLNGAGFRPEFDELIVSDSIETFIRKGYLCDYQYYSISSSSDLQSRINTMKIDKLDGDYLDAEMMNVMDRQEIRAEIVNTYLKFAKGKKGIVYAVNKAHSLHIKQQFESVGVKAEVVDCETPKEERCHIVNKFRRGEIEVLCNVNIFSEGFDCPDIEFIQLARPTCSLALYLQQVGRGLRPAEGKERVVILDNVGLYNKFGFPSARRKWKYHFEGKDVQDEINSHIEVSKEGELREVLPIEEGNEEVVLLLDTNNEKKDKGPSDYKDVFEFDKVNTCINDAQQMCDKIKSLIDGLTEMGVVVPQDLYDKLDEYNKQLDPSQYIKSYLEKSIFESFKMSQLVDFEYDTKLKQTLNNEMSEVNNQIRNHRDQVVKVNQIIEGLSSLEISIPDSLFLEKDKWQNALATSEDKLLFLSEMEKQLHYLSAKYVYHAIFVEGKLTVDNSCTNNCKERFHSKVPLPVSLIVSQKTPRAKKWSVVNWVEEKNRKVLSVVLPNGRIIKNSKQLDTLVEFVKWVGVEKVKNLGLSCNNVPLISDTLDEKYSKAQHYLGDGLYLMSNSSTERKKKQIGEICRLLNLNVDVTLE